MRYFTKEEVVKVLNEPNEPGIWYYPGQNPYASTNINMVRVMLELRKLLDDKEIA